ncbi:M48 family metalloprotease [bacterium]|nr:M48 family metalloprotease [bacterium]
MKKMGFIFPLILIFLFSGCATFYNPVTKKEEYTLYTEKDEIDMGRAIDKKIQREFKIIPTPENVEKIGQKIAKVCDRPNLKYTFRVIKGKEINAFSVPGGFVYIYTGLLEKITSDDELACIIGHEIGHICARDGVHRLQAQILYSIPATILLSKTRSAAIQKSVDTVFTLTMLKYSREEELRADRLGVIYAFKAGYDPEGMIRFFEKLKEMEKGTLKLPAFLRNHPDVEARMENVRKTIEELKKE